MTRVLGDRTHNSYLRFLGFVLVSILLVAFLVGRVFRNDVKQSDGWPRELQLEFTPPDTQIASMADNAFIDLSEQRSNTVWLIEGWLTSKRRTPRLFIRNLPGAKVVSSYLFERADLADIPNAIGFGIVLEGYPIFKNAPCILNKRSKFYRQLSGSSC